MHLYVSQFSQPQKYICFGANIQELFEPLFSDDAKFKSSTNTPEPYKYLYVIFIFGDSIFVWLSISNFCGNFLMQNQEHREYRQNNQVQQKTGTVMATVCLPLTKFDQFFSWHFTKSKSTYDQSDFFFRFLWSNVLNTPDTPFAYTRNKIPILLRQTLGNTSPSLHTVRSKSTTSEIFGQNLQAGSLQNASFRKSNLKWIYHRPS